MAKVELIPLDYTLDLLFTINNTHIPASVAAKPRAYILFTMASETPDMETVAQALKQVAEDGKMFMNNDPSAREKLVASARALVLAAETPMDSLLWHVWALVWDLRHRVAHNTLMNNR